MWGVICQRNTDIIWFKKLKSPHVPLGIPIEDGLAILKKIGSPAFFESEGERQYKVSNSAYNVAIYETNGIVSSAWYDDPIGRSWNLGRQKKVILYLLATTISVTGKLGSIMDIFSSILTIRLD